MLQTLLATQSALLALFLLTRPRQQSRHYRYLAGFLITLTVHMGLNILNAQVESALDLSSALGFLYGPWMYLHTRSVLGAGRVSLRQQWPHGLPAVGVLASVCAAVPIPQQMLAGSVTASLEAYLLLAWYAIKSYTEDSKNLSSEALRSDLSWLRKVILSLMVIGGLDFVHSITLASAIRWSPWFYAMLIFSLWSIVNYLIYQGLHQSQLFGAVSEDSKASHPIALSSHESSDPTIQEPHLERMVRIEEAIQRPSLLTDPNLTLGRFSEQVGLSSRKISEAINTTSCQSFSDFVNHHRISHACAKLKDPANDHKTILEILYESGFCTKSNFYAAFKKKMGQTPVEFRKMAKKESRMKEKGPVS